MKIQFFALGVLLAIVATQILQMLLPAETVLQTHCIVGKKGQKSIVDCVGCMSFLSGVSQRGEIILQWGERKQEQVQSDDAQQMNTQIISLLYVQEGCAQFECIELQNTQDFYNDDVINNLGLVFQKQIYQQEQHRFWQISFPYDNHVFHMNSFDNIRKKATNYLTGLFLQSVFSEEKSLYKRLAVKLRFSVPFNMKNEDIYKPLIKSTVFSQSKANLVLISVLITSIVYFKKNIISSHRNLDTVSVLLCLSFISPYLFSIISLVIMGLQTPYQIVSLLFFAFSLFNGQPAYILLSSIFGSFIHYKKVGQHVGKGEFVLFNAIIGLALIFNLESVLSMTPNLLCAFTLNSGHGGIQKIPSNHSIQISQMEDSHLDDN